MVLAIKLDTGGRVGDKLALGMEYHNTVVKCHGLQLVNITLIPLLSRNRKMIITIIIMVFVGMLPMFLSSVLQLPIVLTAGFLS